MYLRNNPRVANHLLFKSESILIQSLTRFKCLVALSVLIQYILDLKVITTPVNKKNVTG